MQGGVSKDFVRLRGRPVRDGGANQTPLATIARLCNGERPTTCTPPPESENIPPGGQEFQKPKKSPPPDFLDVKIQGVFSDTKSWHNAISIPRALFDLGFRFLEKNPGPRRAANQTPLATISPSLQRRTSHYLPRFFFTKFYIPGFSRKPRIFRSLEIVLNRLKTILKSQR